MLKALIVNHEHWTSSQPLTPLFVNYIVVLKPLSSLDFLSRGKLQNLFRDLKIYLTKMLGHRMYTMAFRAWPGCSKWPTWPGCTQCTQYDLLGLAVHSVHNMTYLAWLNTVYTIWHNWPGCTQCTQYDLIGLAVHSVRNDLLGLAVHSVHNMTYLARLYKVYTMT